MGYKLIDATEVRDGTSFIIDGEPCTATKVDISKSGKHGASKVRIEAVGIVDGKKRIVAKPGSARRWRPRWR